MSVLAGAYLDVKTMVVNAGYADEIDWQASIQFSDVDEREFLSEGAFVILNSGMRASVVRKKWPGVRSAFLSFESAETILANRDQCRQGALESFGHKQKIEAIIRMCEKVSKEGFSSIKQQIAKQGVSYLQRFPFIGPITCYHLAKNLGLNVAKPDRHLNRVAKIAGFQTAQALCEEVSSLTGDSVAVVDLVIWRFAALSSDGLTTMDYRDWFSSRLRGDSY